MAFPTDKATNTSLPTNYVTGNVLPASVINTSNNEVQQIETKLGIGASTPTTTGQVLTVTGNGSSAWQALPAGSGYAPGGTDVAVADGGTGASTAAGARSNLGAAASGANSDIASLTGLTTPLNTAQGGTGTTTGTANRRIVSGTFATTFTPDGTATDTLRLTLTGNITTFNVPSGTPVDDQRIKYEIKQDSTGSRTIAWASGYSFPGGTAPTLSTGAGATDVVAFVYSSAATKWRYYGILSYASGA